MIIGPPSSRPTKPLSDSATSVDPAIRAIADSATEVYADALASDLVFPEFALIESVLVQAVMESMPAHVKFKGEAVRDAAQLVFRLLERAAKVRDGSENDLMDHIPIALTLMAGFMLAMGRLFHTGREMGEFEREAIMEGRRWDTEMRGILETVPGMMQVWLKVGGLLDEGVEQEDLVDAFVGMVDGFGKKETEE